MQHNNTKRINHNIKAIKDYVDELVIFIELRTAYTQTSTFINNTMIG